MSASGSPVEYPPADHILRDLALEYQHGATESRALMPINEHLVDDHGWVRAGLLATLVDVIGGGLAAIAAAPGWIATADLTLHTVEPVGVGTLEAVGRVVRAGRTTCVIETEVQMGATRVAWSTMTFAVLARRDSNPVIATPGGVVINPTRSMALPTSGMRAPLLESVGISSREHAAWIAEPSGYIENSLGAVQGGVVAMLADRAVEVAAAQHWQAPARTVDMHLHYFALNRNGPIEANASVLDGATPTRAAVSVEITDHSSGRLTTAAACIGRACMKVPEAFGDTAPLRQGLGRFVGSEMHEVGDWENGEIVVVGTATLGDHVRGENGNVYPGVVLMMFDNVPGFTSGLASLPDGWVVTTNLSARAAGDGLRCDGALEVTSRIRRAGKNAVVCDSVATDLARGVTVAVGTLTSAVLVPEFGVPVWERPATLRADEHVDLPDFYTWLDVVALDSACVSVELRDGMRNPWGILHGGVIAVLVDIAGTKLVGGDAATVDVMIHYLAPGRVGPVHAHAVRLGERADGTLVRIEVRDHGNGDRLMAVAVTTVR